MKYKPCYIKLRKEKQCAIVMTDDDILFLLNETGYEILQLISLDLSRDDMVNNLLKKYSDINPCQMENDIDDYLSFMINKRIIEIVR